MNRRLIRKRWLISRDPELRRMAAKDIQHRWFHPRVLVIACPECRAAAGLPQLGLEARAKAAYLASDRAWPQLGWDDLSERTRQTWRDMAGKL